MRNTFKLCASRYLNCHKLLVQRQMSQNEREREVSFGCVTLFHSTRLDSPSYSACPKQPAILIRHHDARKDTARRVHLHTFSPQRIPNAPSNIQAWPDQMLLVQPPHPPHAFLFLPSQ
uniref:Uncharacterized protein n=1 Tax=Physcomitrium patens TaxID=3218 RepID=A0A7I3ZHZ0_PHYPA